MLLSSRVDAAHERRFLRHQRVVVDVSRDNNARQAQMSMSCIDSQLGVTASNKIMQQRQRIKRGRGESIPDAIVVAITVVAVFIVIIGGGEEGENQLPLLLPLLLLSIQQ
jgi:hypothetical protein